MCVKFLTDVCKVGFFRVLVKVAVYSAKDEAFEACFWVCRVAQDELVWVELFFKYFEAYFVVFNRHCDVKDVYACFEFGEKPHQGGGVV